MRALPYIGFLGTDWELDGEDETRVIKAWHAFVVTNEVCRKTGLREDDGSKAFLDKGTLATLEVHGGECDGFTCVFHDPGGLIFTEADLLEMDMEGEG